MTSKRRNTLIETLDWRGYLIEVRYRPARKDDEYLSHLELEALEPARVPLPVTGTGYRSEFIGRGIVEAEGGPAA